jgi:PKD repeat protein
MGSREPARLRSAPPQLVFSLLAFALSACGGGGGGLTFPATTGTLQVTTSTTGDEPDVDGYMLQVDGEPPAPIGPAGSFQRTEVTPGPHTLRLDNLASNCSVADNPRTVQIVAGDTLASAFEVTCTATSGGVVVTTVTTGAALDPDGYGVVLDGVDQGPVPANGQVSLTGLPLGSHVVGLSGLAGNCQLQGENLRAVTVTPAGSTPVDYAITCAAPPPNAGTLQVITVTTGDSPDPDGYNFALDGGANQPIAGNATASIINLAPGSHRVQLSGLADNCRIQGGGASRSVNVAAGGTTDVTFRVSCSRPSGNIRVTVSTTGNPADPDGYLVQLDNVGPGRRIAADGNTRFEGVAVGSHTVSLSDNAPNCTITEGPSRTVAVTTEGTANVSFRVTCAAVGSNRIELVSGNNQSAPAGSVLPEPLVVKVTDPSGNPVADVTVNWSAEGGGSVSAGSTRTGADGQTFVNRTLGPEPGEQTTRATADGLTGSPVVFTSTATSNKTASTTTITSDDPDPSIQGDVVHVQFTVTGDGGSPSGDVTVTVNDGPESCTGTVAGGSCDITLTNLGSRTLIATYAGDANFSGSSDREVHLVNEPPPENTPPTAAFDAPTCTTNQPCQFTDQSTDDGTITDWLWDFGDGQTSNERNPQHTFGAANAYEVKLTVTDDAGATNTVTHTVTVSDPAQAQNSPPEAAFNASLDCIANRPCGFTDRSSDPDGDGTLTAWSWDFGDGSDGSTLRNPDHTYQLANDYLVTLTVRDDHASSNDAQQMVTIGPAAVNTAPTAKDDNYTTAQGVSLHAPGSSIPGLLDNDEDPEGDPIFATVETKSTREGGTVSINQDGSFDYTPPPDFTGADNFEYTVTDSKDASSTAHATIQVQAG